MNLAADELRTGHGHLPEMIAQLGPAPKTPPPSSTEARGGNRRDDEVTSGPPFPSSFRGEENKRDTWSRLRRGGGRAVPAFKFLLALFSLALFLSGCGSPPRLVHQYLLEYPSPPLKGQPLDAAIKVGRFAVAEPFNTTAMIYKPAAFKSESYQYNRWRVNPGYLASDYLVRDLRSAGLFKAVFSYDREEKARFALEGGVEDFQEVDEPGGWQAALTLNVTLLDTSQEEAPQKVVFQKTYREREPMVLQTPEGLAESMSRAMEKASAEIISDVYAAARKRLAAGEGGAKRE